MGIICGKVWRTSTARDIKMSRELHCRTPPNYLERLPRSPQNPSFHRQKHVRKGMDAPYIQARRREGHEEEYKEIEIK